MQVIKLFAMFIASVASDGFVRNARDLLYWNRMYNSLKSNPNQTTRHGLRQTPMCQMMRHLSQTSQFNRIKYQLEMRERGCF